MAAARVVHVACYSEFPGMVNTLRKQLLESTELTSKALIAVKGLDPNNCSDELQNAEVVFADQKFLQAHLKSLSQARWIHSTTAGVDHVVSEIKKLNLTPSFLFTRSGGVFGQVMAEYVIGQIIANERMFYSMHNDQKNAQWAQQRYADHCRPLTDISIGILGVGDIGKRIAAVSKLLGMHTWGLVRALPLQTTKCPYIDEYRTLPELEELLGRCDYICNVLPSTSETRGLLSGHVLECCKKQAVLINIGRGDVTDEDTIVRAIRSKWLSGAILDVFPVEPLPRSSPLWSMPEVVVTPHVSGSGLEHQVCRAFVANLRLYIAGRPLEHVVDWDREY